MGDRQDRQAGRAEDMLRNSVLDVPKRNERTDPNQQSQATAQMKDRMLKNDQY